MAIVIDDPETERIIRELAELMGVDETEAVRDAVTAMLRKKLNAVTLEQLKALPVLDGRPWREIRDELSDGL